MRAIACCASRSSIEEAARYACAPGRPVKKGVVAAAFAALLAGAAALAAGVRPGLGLGGGGAPGRGGGGGGPAEARGNRRETGGIGKAGGRPHPEEVLDVF